jgi:hypothetical protein
MPSLAISGHYARGPDRYPNSGTLRRHTSMRSLAQTTGEYATWLEETLATTLLTAE